jgi:hypothetical protein
MARQRKVSVEFIAKCDASILPRLLEQWHGNLLETIMLVAAIVARMLRDGTKVPSYVKYPDKLRQIHSGKMIPGLYYKYIAEEDPLCKHIVDSAVHYPKPVQTAVVRNTPIVLLDEAGKKIGVRPTEMTPAQAKQVCGPTNFRTVKEQRDWLKDQKDDEKAVEKPYVIYAAVGEVKFTRDCLLRRAEIQEILDQLNRGKTRRRA